MPRDILHHLADHYGHVQRNLVVPQYLAASSWTRAIHSGRIVIVQPGVALVAHASVTPEQQISAAILASGDGAMASGLTAAWLHGASVPFVSPLHIVSPTRPRNKRLVGAVVHRPLDLIDLQPCEVKHIPTAPPFRTLLDTAAWNPGLAGRVLEHFLVTSELTIRSSWRNLFAHARQGRPGIVCVKNLLNSWSLDTEKPESVLEARMLSLCFNNNFPAFEFQARIGDYRVDFLWRNERVILECDGFAFHGSTRDAFENDRRRDADLQSMGYTVWRFSYRQITEDPKFVVKSIGSAFSVPNCALNGLYGAENPQKG